MASTEALERRLPIERRPLAEAVWPLSIEAGWNQNVADWRFMLGAGRGFGCHGRGRQMAGERAGPAARPEARLDQHGAGDQGAAAQRARHRLLKRCIDEVTVGRCRRRPRCHGAGTADLPAARASTISIRISRWHFDRGEGRGSSLRPPASGCARSARRTCPGSRSMTGR